MHSFHFFLQVTNPISQPLNACCYNITTELDLA